MKGAAKESDERVEKTSNRRRCNFMNGEMTEIYNDEVAKLQVKILKIQKSNK
jgi:hypothetical protein